MIEILQYLIRTLNYGNYGIFLVMGDAGCNYISNRIPHLGTCEPLENYARDPQLRGH